MQLVIQEAKVEGAISPPQTYHIHNQMELFLS